jgi:hypothetical protein
MGYSTLRGTRMATGLSATAVRLAPGPYVWPASQNDRVTEQEQKRRLPLLGTTLVVLALAVFGLSVLVGFVGPKPGFQWELASVFGTALGTTSLALATGALAWSTRTEVRATQELAELTKKDQDARERPVVIQLAANFQRSDDQCWINVQLINVGLGPALRIKVTATYVESEHQPEIDTVTWPSLAPNEQTNFSISVRFDPLPSSIRPDGFTPVSYTQLTLPTN